ncbi:hematopoietic prostaglandin D synthase-like [Lytechinus variegatus]|uniref:hematopoietic prostaglandin D synthase-like n=1 Tax=Lytechinus variegatus TaxID=7654 RepID=UPI001BB1AD43|nr:hematopoietic prostaglandin D synthase-like [Lytechinus variegatus]
MPTYKLTYFDVRGRGEIIRLVFAQAGVEYEDDRIVGSTWDSIKGDRKRFPMGCVPVLEVDGMVMIQSMAIARHLSKKYGLAGKDEKEMAVVDMVSDLCTDMLNEMFDLMFEKDEKRKEEMTTKFLKKSDTYMEAFTRCLQKNGDGTGYLIGDTVTLADLALFNLLEQLAAKYADMLTKNPPMQEFLDRMKKEPKVSAWLEKRPKGEMDI